MSVSVLLKVFPGEAIVRALPGQVVGRGMFAAVPVPHARVSEAHAVLSLRSSLLLLGARGDLSVDGQVVRRVELRAGQVIALLPDLAARLEVLRVDQAPEFLGLSVDGGAPVAIPPIEEGYALLDGKPVAAKTRPARFWSAGEDWYVLPDGEDPSALEVGAEWQVEGHTVQLCNLLPPKLVSTETLAPNMPVYSTLKAVKDAVGYRVDAYGTDGQVFDLLGGQPGNILGQLLTSVGPRPWTEIAAPMWEAQADKNSRLLQNNFDTNLRLARQWLTGLEPPSRFSIARQSQRVWLRKI